VTSVARATPKTRADRNQLDKIDGANCPSPPGTLPEYEITAFPNHAAAQSSA